ncbi:MAG: 1-deoxy-D-xylulose-5-phosphate reductoisomerase [Nitrosomonadales bacterium]|mgnify:FL=1|nr:1-deoxy-D-xylulose-5-phosphate reductoisomerase [Nitrosomonadales bacterium]|tara:strand:+ start:606 stop:1778 length:1173 start_codon:yes stop_codon:yes gene_type:complete
MEIISILGSTGSIGCSALDVIKLHPDKFKVFALSGHKNTSLLFKQTLEFNPSYVVVKDENSQSELSILFKEKNLKTEILIGEEGHKYIAGNNDVTLVLAAITGSAGLISTMEAAKKGKKILLANKESMVMAGNLLSKECEENNGLIIPVDSEHNAIFQVIHDNKNIKEINKLILTASGGPFRSSSLKELKNVSVEDALNHPNWTMGKKVTIDSATMMNKGLEVIEAAFLFKIDYRKIEVLIHPQSIIHSLVEFIDGSSLSQLGTPDMKVPIAYALSYPKRVSSGISGIDLSKSNDLQFHLPDLKKFSCLKLAYECLEHGGSYPIEINAANEIAVNAFLENKIKFLQISELIKTALNNSKNESFNTIEEILLIDQRARKKAEELLKEFKIA